ncbi:hypothetical protein PIB30_070718 [Stylosanthes scabra]|uniref:F-box associated domain-containing protein n=1 Tax=Stylosanthes scabra TaxID=79078 RepID=A0ABU6SQI8_9FABA|nr:hypothetical protein [Stylosanthes scabra]
MAMSHDELYEIFSWLPAKSIHKFKASSKILSEFLEDPHFALKQAKNSLTKCDTWFFMQTHNHIEFHALLGEQDSSGVPKDMLGFLSTSAKILSSSNGLLLCSATGRNQVELFVTNPATQSYVWIPTPKNSENNIDADLKIILECDQDDFNVFLFDIPNWGSNLDCKVYNHKEGSWKENQVKKFFTGTPYFRPYIISYNFDNNDNNKPTMLRVPKEARRGSHDNSCDMRIFKWGKVNESSQSICLVRLRKRVFTIWVLMNYELGSWRRILKVRVKAMLGSMEQNPSVKGFIILKDDLVFATEKKVHAYGLTNDRYMKLWEVCDHGFKDSGFCFIPYFDTLRPCGIGAKNLCYFRRDILSQEHDVTSTYNSGFECR